MIFSKEKGDLRLILKLADQWGYGNIICFLERGWAEKLKKSGIPEKNAVEATLNRTPYSIELFNEIIGGSQ